jgi:hypothetical protein
MDHKAIFIFNFEKKGIQGQFAGAKINMIIKSYGRKY